MYPLSQTPGGGGILVAIGIVTRSLLAGNFWGVTRSVRANQYVDIRFAEPASGSKN